MLIVIVGLVLVVAVMASHPKLDQQGSPQGLPQDTNIPAQGTSGVPSPGPAVTDNQIATTQRGMLSLGTNAGFLSMKYGRNKIPSSIPTDVVSSTPLGVPDQEKALDTQARADALTTFYDMPKGATGFRKL